MENIDYEYGSKDSFDINLEDEIIALNEDIDNQEDLDLSDYQSIGYDNLPSEKVNDINVNIPLPNKQTQQSFIDLSTINSNYSFDKRSVLSQDIGNIKFGIESNDSEELKYIKSILNGFIEKLPKFDEKEWEKIAEDLGSSKSLGKASPIKVYKIASLKFLIGYARELNLLLLKEGEKVSVYNNSFWNEVDEEFIKVFIGMACVKLGVPKWQAHDSKFIKDIYCQLIGNNFFMKMDYQNETCINLQNGTLKIGLNGIKLSPFNAYDFMTYKLDFSYDSQAVNIEWINFIDDVLPDKETQRTLQEALGYLFVQGLKLEQVILLFGTGSNGKSVVNEVINGLLGDELVTHYSLEILTNPKSYQRANIANKLINSCSDIKLDKIDLAEFKILASGEKAQVRQIYQTPYIMTRYAKFIFNINTIDNANVESTIGFFRRMTFIPFEKTIPKERQDKFLPDRILQNKAGVLNWILEGTKQVIQNQEIFMSQRCYKFLDNFMKESNLVVRFVEDSNLIASSYDDIIDFQTMYDIFVDFCKKQGEKPLKQRLFNKELKKLNIPFDRKNYGYIWFARFLK